jgi:outer membrane protein OmpA-like peptidoglycan-associated protein
MTRKLLLAFLTLMICFKSTYSQRYLGVATSNWGGTNALYLNPALMGNSRVKWSIDLFSLNMGVDNNFASLKTDNFFSKLTNADKFKVADFLNYNSADKVNLTIPGGEVRGPGFYISINDKHSLSLTTRARVFNQFRGFSSTLFRSVVDDNFKDQNGNIPLAEKDFNWTANVWSELGLTYAFTLLDNGEHVLRAGVTARYLGGAGYIGLYGKSVNANYFNAQDSVRVNSADFHIASNLASGEGISSVANSGGFFDGFLGKGGGLGFGGDFGLTYEYRPDYRSHTYEMDGDKFRMNPEEDAYAFRISAAITDVGSIRYKKANQQAAVSGSGYFKPKELGDILDDHKQTEAYLRQHGLKTDTNSNASTISLPTALVFGFDYHIHKHFYANATFIGGLNKPTDKLANVTYTQLSVTPRYDSRVISVGIPLTYNFTSQSFKAGIGFRVAGFVLGSDDVLALVGGKNAKGANFYLGASIPINKRKLADKDGDKVSNKMDKCPEVLGQWQFLGCPPPDKDGDGVMDSLDKCPDVKGIAATNGCPDRDNDGIADGEDLCPDDAGAVATKGCPDRDNDVVADKDDLCPDVAGLAKYQGCPDTDGDGVPDNEDKCVDKAGPAAQQGCPDTDNDGISDNLDKCPDVPGTQANNGCPEVKEEVKKRLAFAATAIQFETGKANIKKVSYKLLDEIVNILNEYPDYMMTINGHTDNVGKPAKNLELSKNRAASVKNYFVSKGIGESRIATDGHGDTQPKASNKTAKGRAQNRRVDMDLKLK